MCFAHLMRHEDIETVLDHRLQDIGMYQDMFREFERECIAEWPEGQKFVLGFGKAVAKAMATYIRENRHMLTGQPATKTATG
jgi:hypothetical protein